MSRITKVKNDTLADKDWLGQTILVGEYHTIINGDINDWKADSEVFTSVANGELIVNDGAADITDPVEGWNWMLATNEFPLSEIDGTKIAVHASTKPFAKDKTIYAVWIGAGDNMATGEIGGGTILDFDLAPGTSDVTVDVKFHANNGPVWLHEGYLRFQDGGHLDYVDASVIGEPTPVQTSVNLDLELDGTTIKFAAGGPGTGTHGFADANVVVLAGRGYSGDGDWDFDGVNLTPNMAGTGGFRISTAEQIVHRFIHKVPVHGTSPFFSMSSEEATQVLPNYFLRVQAHNVSDTTWTASMIVEAYRERTYNP